MIPHAYILWPDHEDVLGRRVQIETTKVNGGGWTRR